MNLSLKYPTWATALWLLLLSRFHDGSTSLNTAAAFVPEPPWNAKASLHDKPKRRPLADNERQRVSLASTATVSPRSSRPTVSSVTRLHLPCSSTSKNPWAQLVPPITLFDDDKSTPPGQGMDITVEWQPDDDVTEVPRSMLEQTEAFTRKGEDVLVEHLTQCMHTFQSFCQEHFQVASSSYNDKQPPLSTNSIQGFRARMVATRGPRGTKCPRWHVDHVPVRWIQSLVGPGCNFIECTDDRQAEGEWDRIQYHLERDEHDKVVPIAGPSHLQVHQASEQEAALLVGNRWNEFTKESRQRFVPPVLHKSPDIPFWQGRVLLTMDVIVPHRDDD